MSCVAFDKANLRQAGSTKVRTFDQRVRDIDPDNAPIGPYPFGKLQHTLASTAADIDDHFRFPGRESIDGALSQRGKLEIHQV